jgi:hypothetical protein
MHNSPKAIPLRESVFFKNASSARPLVDGRSRAARCRTTRVLHREERRGRADALPFALTAEVLDRGEQRFNIYCTPCHGLTGKGDGMIVRRGYRQPPSFHIDRLRRRRSGISTTS